MNPKKNTKVISKLALLALLVSVIFISCDQAKETIEETADKVAEKTGEVISETAEKVGETAEDAVDKVGEVAEEVLDKTSETVEDATNKVEEVVMGNTLTGVWVGKLDSRLTTLSITNQDGNNIEGKITINYRKPLNQEIKGSFNADTKTLTMKDQLHSRFKGTYNGKLSEDGKTYSGTFTTLVEKKNYNFNLVKK